MRCAPVHILLLALVCLGAGCARHGKVIPQEKMVRIYRDMFLADQWVRDNPEARVAADTTYFFDPIFKRYGYSFEDYDLSVHYYLDRPEKYAKILSDASERLRRENERLNKALSARREAERERDRLHGLYKSEEDFRKDSLFVDVPGILWPVPAPDSLAAVDTLAVPSDSLAVRSDTLSVADTLSQPRLIELPDGRTPGPLRGELPKPRSIRKTDH